MPLFNRPTTWTDVDYYEMGEWRCPNKKGEMENTLMKIAKTQKNEISLTRVLKNYTHNFCSVQHIE